MTREGFLEHSEECRRDCCVLVVPLKIRDSLALMIDVALAALNAAFGFLKVSLQEGTLHAVILTTSGQRLYQSSFSPADTLADVPRVEVTLYRVWYWAMIDREHDGRFIASIRRAGAHQSGSRPLDE
jgi:hypothetical protein